MTTANKRRALAGAAGVLVFGGGALIARVSTPVALSVAAATTPSSAPAPDEAPSPKAADVSRVAGCAAIAAGTELAYVLSTRSVTKLDVGNDGPTMEQASHATIALRALGSDPKTGTLMLARLREVDDASVGQAETVEDPFMLRVDPSCQITAFAHLGWAKLAEARLQQALAYEMQWSWPSPADASPAHMTGENAVGAYRATMEINGSSTLTRRIKAYTRTWSDEWTRGPQAAGAGAAKENIPTESALVISAGAGPWFASLSGTQVMTIEGREGASTARVTVRTKLTVASREFPKGALDGMTVDEKSYVWEDMLPKRPPVRKSDEVLEKREAKAIALHRGVPTGKAMTELETRVASKQNIAQQWPELTRFLRANPERTGDVVKMLREGKVSDEASGAVYVALSQAPTSEARMALLAIKDDVAAGPFERTRALQSLVRREDVGADLARELHQEAFAMFDGKSRGERLYGRHAALALGTMGAVHTEDPQIADEARSLAKELLARGRNARALRPGFKAIANLGDVSMLASVKPFMSHVDPTVREASAIAFRRMPPAQTSGMVSTWLRRETNPDVKRAIYRVVQLQTVGMEEPLDEALTTVAVADLDARPDAMTRQSLIRMLGRASATSGAARDALVRAVRAEASENPDLASLAARYLSGEEMRDVAGTAAARVPAAGAMRASAPAGAGGAAGEALEMPATNQEARAIFLSEEP